MIYKRSDKFEHFSIVIGLSTGFTVISTSKTTTTVVAAAAAATKDELLQTVFFLWIVTTFGKRFIYVYWSIKAGYFAAISDSNKMWFSVFIVDIMILNEQSIVGHVVLCNHCSLFKLLLHFICGETIKFWWRFHHRAAHIILLKINNFNGSTTSFNHNRSGSDSDWECDALCEMLLTLNLLKATPLSMPMSTRMAREPTFFAKYIEWLQWKSSFATCYCVSL